MSSKLGKAKINPLGSFSNPEKMQLLTSYRKTIASYIPVGPDDIDRKFGIPLLVSPKIDGELWFMLYENSWILVAPNGRTIEGALEILESATNLNLDTSTIFAGELHILADSRTRIGDLTKALASGDTLDTKMLAFAVFDILTSTEITAAGTPYSTRFEKIKNLPNKGNFYYIPTEKTNNTEQVNEQFEKLVIQKQHEGLVARSDDARTFKIKPNIEFDAAIIGFTEKRLSDGEYAARTVLVGLNMDEDIWLPIAAVGNIGDDAFRKELYKELKSLVVKSSYRKSSESSGVMYQFVAPRIVAEFKALDLQAEDASGKKIKDPKLCFDDGAWRVSGWSNSVSIHNPTLLRLRTDKAAKSDDVGLNQITRILAIEEMATDSTSATSNIIVRKVWTKDEAVRKLVIWKTNKESIGYSSFVVHWTDYSPSRKAPLAREVRLAPSESIAKKIADDMVSENIKKGWVEYK